MEFLFLQGFALVEFPFIFDVLLFDGAKLDDSLQRIIVYNSLCIVLLSRDTIQSLKLQEKVLSL